MILLDTNVLSEAMRVEPAGRVMRWLDGHPPSVLFLSAVTVDEIPLRNRDTPARAETGAPGPRVLEDRRRVLGAYRPVRRAGRHREREASRRTAARGFADEPGRFPDRRHGQEPRLFAGDAEHLGLPGPRSLRPGTALNRSADTTARHPSVCSGPTSSTVSSPPSRRSGRSSSSTTAPTGVDRGDVRRAQPAPIPAIELLERGVLHSLGA